MVKKKIAIFIVSLYGGGAERVVSILLKQLATDFTIHLIILDTTVEYEIPDGQTIFLLDKGTSKNKFLNILKIPLLALRYKKYLKKNNIETSLSLLPRPNFINCFTKIWGYKGKIIISERQYTAHYYLKQTFSGITGRVLVKWLYPKAALIVCNAALIATGLKTIFKIKTNYKIINNPVDIAAIHLTHPDKITQPFTFASMGRLSEEKNYALLIKAAALLGNMDFIIKLTGKGPLYDNLQNEITKHNLQHKVFILPYTNNPFSFLKSAQCFVLSSNSEGFPNALIEAMACGLPVISTDCKSGPREILAPGTDLISETEENLFCKYGILIPLNNPQAMADAMKTIMTDTTMQAYYSTASTERVQDYGVEKIMNEFKAIL